MRQILALGLLVAALGACATPPDQSAQPVDGGGVALSIVGTPFLIAFKIPVCLATLLISGPVGGAKRVHKQIISEKPANRTSSCTVAAWVLWRNETRSGKPDHWARVGHRVKPVSCWK